MSDTSTVSTINVNEGHPGTIGTTPQVTAVVKLHKIGNSWGVYLFGPVRAAMGLLPGDLIVIRIFGKRAILSRFDAAKAAPITEKEHASANGSDSRAQGR